MTTTETPPAIDKEALRRRYRAERDKRLRREGSAQYRRLAGELAAAQVPERAQQRR